MIHNITPLRNLANYIELPLFFIKGVKGGVGVCNYTASNNKAERRITIQNDFPKWKKIVCLSHELGHSLQSPKEFEISKELTHVDKAEFIISVEKDAWEKGERLINVLYQNMSEDFWNKFNDYKKMCLGTYLEAVESNLYCTILFDNYRNFIFQNQAGFQPIGSEFFDSLKQI